MALAGFVVGGIGLMVGDMTVFWIGVALAPVAVIIGAIMAKMGYGATSDPHA